MRAGGSGLEPAMGRPEASAAPRLRVSVLPDGLSAVATVTPDSVPPTLGEIRRVLEEAGIRHGLIDGALTAIAEGRQGAEVVVAVGEAPIPGDDAWFTPLIEKRREFGIPKILPDGRVDYLDLGFVQAVGAGDPLMRRMPATSGTPGRTVTGQPLDARQGKDRPFRRVGRGTRLSTDDPNLLVAAVAGLPTFGPDFVQVDPILRVPAVDISTGHIVFAGTVVVCGDVAAGLRIEASGDVIVAGTAEGCDIVAGGDVELRCGMVGQGRGKVQAGGTIHARFMEGVIAEAGLDITFEETIAHSQVAAARDVTALSSLGRGQILGGQTVAGRSVLVNVLGAPSGIATDVQVGIDPLRPARLERASRRIEKIRRDLQTTTQNLVAARMAGGNGTGTAGHIARLEALLADEQAAKADLERLAITSPDLDKAIIRSRSFFYAGVDVALGELRRHLRDDVPGATLLRRDGHVVIRA